MVSDTMCFLWCQSKCFLFPILIVDTLISSDSKLYFCMSASLTTFVPFIRWCFSLDSQLASFQHIYPFWKTSDTLPSGTHGLYLYTSCYIPKIARYRTWYEAFICCLSACWLRVTWDKMLKPPGRYIWFMKGNLK